MSQPTVDDAKELWKWAYSRFCFENALAAFEFLENKGQELPQKVGQVIVIGIVTAYATPFKNSSGIEKLDAAKIIPEEYAKLHADVIRVRDKAMAHKDALNFPIDGAFGDANQVRVGVQRTWTGITVTFFGLPPSLKPLLQLLLEKAEYHAERLRAKQISGKLSLGEYVVNISDPSKPAFVSVPRHAFPSAKAP